MEALPTEPSSPPSESTNSYVSISEDSVRISSESLNTNTTMPMPTSGSSTETSNTDSTISVATSGPSTETSNTDSTISVATSGPSTETSNTDSNTSVATSGSSTETSNADSTISVATSGPSTETSNTDSTTSVATSGSSTETSNTDSTISVDELTEPTNKVVGEQSLMVPEPDEPDLKKNLLLNLECPVCYDYMTPPITLCMNGHSVCHTCRSLLDRCPTCRQGFLTTRNIVLENIAREMNLPSTRDSNQDLRERHGQWDPVTPRVYCPLACSWSGEQGDLKAHIMEDHADRILDDSGQEGEHVKTWKLALRVTDKRVIFTQREVFLYRQKLNTLGRVFHVGVQYLGPVSNAATFKYEVELSADDDHQKFVKFRQTLGEDEDIEAAILTGNSCINVDYEIVKTFTSKNLKCACSTAQCVSRESRTCTTRYKCYTQHLDKGDGSDPLTRGCVSGNTPIMCENFYPVVARSKWPLLSCCDDSDFCNEGPFSNPRPLSREHSTAGAKVYNTGEVLLRDLLNHTRFSSNNGSATVNKTYSVNQSVVLSVLFVGLFLLVAILAFGFYVLRKQSTYFKHHMCSILTEEDPSLLVLHSERRNTKPTSKQLQSEKLRCSET